MRVISRGERSMRIAYFSDAFLPKIDGVVVALQTLSGELGRRGHRIAIFCPSPGRGKRIVWSVTNVGLFPVASISTFYPDFRVGAPSPRSLLQLRDFHPHVVHIHSPGPLGMEGLVGAGMLRVPAVFTFHAYFMEPEYLQLVRLSRFQRVSRALWRFVIAFSNRCDFVVAPTAYVAADLHTHGLKKPSAVISNGVDISLLERVDEQSLRSVRRTYGLGSRVVLYVGRLSKEKNLGLLLRAFARVYDALPLSQLLLVGDGPLHSELVRLAWKLGIGQKTIFTGQIEHDQLLSSGIFQASAVFCTPSTSETQGLSVVEAAAAGLPIVGAAARGVQELVDGNGILVRGDDDQGFAQGILGFLRSRRRRERAAKALQQMALNHSIEKVADAMERIYDALVQKQGG